MGAHSDRRESSDWKESGERAAENALERDDIGGLLWQQ